MIFLFILIFIILGVVLFDINTTFSRYKRIAYLFVCSLMFLVVVFAYKMGIDTQTYMADYALTKPFGEYKFNKILEEDYEPGWIFLNILVKSTLDDYFFIKLLCAGGLNIMLFYIIYRYSRYPFFCLLVYYLADFLHFSFEIMRQDLCMIFMLWGMMSLIEGNKKMYLLRALPCVFFHKAGIIVYVLVYLSTFIKYRNIYLILPFGLYFFSYMLKDYFVDFFEVLSLVSEDSADTFDVYANSEKYGDKTETLSMFGILIGFVRTIVCPTFVLLWFDKKQRSKTLCNFIYIFILFSSVKLILGILYRMTAFFSVFYWVSLSNFLFEGLKTRRIDLVRSFVLMIVLFNFTTNITRTIKSEDFGKGNSGYDIRYFPYTSILNEDDPVIERRKMLKQ